MATETLDLFGFDPSIRSIRMRDVAFSKDGSMSISLSAHTQVDDLTLISQEDWSMGIARWITELNQGDFDKVNKYMAKAYLEYQQMLDELAQEKAAREKDAELGYAKVAKIR